MFKSTVSAILPFIALCVAGCAQRAAEVSEVPAAAAPPAGQVTFASHIAPIFEQRCARCHSNDTRRGNLSLASLDDTLAGGKSGAAVVPGNPEGSLLLSLVLHQREPFMPRRAEPLSTSDTGLIRDWIASGAK